MRCFCKCTAYNPNGKIMQKQMPVSSPNQYFCIMAVPEKIILGIDPGTNVLGYGVLKQSGRTVAMEAMGSKPRTRCRGCKSS